MDSEFAYITTAGGRCKHSVSNLDGEVGYFGMLPTGMPSQLSLFCSIMEGYKIEQDNAG
jgi:hypothetical protein